MHRPRARLLASLAPAIAVAVLVAACGGSSKPSTSASGNTSTAASSQTTTGPSKAEIAARLSLARCLRGQGINVPDPSPTTGGFGGAGGVGGEARRLFQQYGQTRFQAALTACRQYAVKSFPALALSPAQRAQREQQLLQFAQCMRSHGVDIPDPTPNASGGLGLGLGRALRTIDRASPVFKSALSACQSLRPHRLGGGGTAG